MAFCKQRIDSTAHGTTPAANVQRLVVVYVDGLVKSVSLKETNSVPQIENIISAQPPAGKQKLLTQKHKNTCWCEPFFFISFQ